MHPYRPARSGGGAIGFLALALAVAFPALAMTVVATGAGLATQAVTAVAAEASVARPGRSPQRPGRAASCPVDGKVRFSDTWGAPRDGGARRHRGVDMFAKTGTPLVAVARARVVRAGWSGSKGGLAVTLRTSRGTELYYAHLSRVSVHAGQRVRKGQKVGEVGRTGNARRTPPHLHLEVRPHGRTVNPTPYVRAWC
jgi:murein DD-endopeptidase MepM/ murein hydrolase activator NlpD